MNLFISSIIQNNIILTKFLGICPFIGVSKSEKNSVGMGITVIFVMLISSIINYLIYYLVLKTTKTIFLRTIIFILVIATFTQIVEIILKKNNPKLHNSLGIFLPLVATNCAILGTNLLNINNNFNFIEMILFTLGSGLGFALVIYIFSTIRTKLDKLPIPKCFQGAPIAFIIASIMSLIFSRYLG